MAGTRKREQPQGAVWLDGMLDLLKGGALGACAALVTLGVAACLIWSGLLANSRSGSAVVAACLLGGFAGGLLAIRRGTLAALPGGLGAGAVLFLLLLTAGTLVCDTLPALRSGGVVAGACLCGGGLAGVLGRSGGSKKRRKR